MRSMIYNAPIIDRTLEPRVTQSLACAPAGSADVVTDPLSWSTVSRPLFDANQANELHGCFSLEPQEVASADHSNQQYSITAVTTSAGAIAERYAYSAYGEPTILDASGSQISNSSISNRYSYTGREWDATVGLYHFRARWLSPKTGRFLGRDPIGYLGSPNFLYEQLASNPTETVDPYGLSWGTAGFIWHYYYGWGAPVHLANMGLLERFKEETSGYANRYLSLAHSGALNRMTCSSAGSFSASFEQSFTQSYYFGNRGGGIIDTLDALYVLGRSDIEFVAKYSADWTCTECCNGFLYLTSVNMTSSVFVRLQDAFTNPVDFGGADDDPIEAAAFGRCAHGCYLAYGSEGADWYQCWFRCEEKFPDVKGNFKAVPYAINADYTLERKFSFNRPCPGPG